MTFVCQYVTHPLCLISSRPEPVCSDSPVCFMLQNHELKDLLPYGFAIHHAGMTRYDTLLINIFKLLVKCEIPYIPDFVWLILSYKVVYKV